MREWVSERGRERQRKREKANREVEREGKSECVKERTGETETQAVGEGGEG